MEAGYQSAEFAEYCHSLSYRIETSPTRDKHARGIADRSVGNIVTKANIAMLGNINNPCPQQFWPDAIEYACHSDGFGSKNKIGTSPYVYINQRHVHLKYLHLFWTPVYFTMHPTNASAVSLELFVPSKATLSDTPTLSSYSHATR